MCVTVAAGSLFMHVLLSDSYTVCTHRTFAVQEPVCNLQAGSGTLTTGAPEVQLPLCGGTLLKLWLYLLHVVASAAALLIHADPTYPEVQVMVCDAATCIQSGHECCGGTVTAAVTQQLSLHEKHTGQTTP